MGCTKCQRNNTPHSVLCKKCATRLRSSAVADISQTRNLLKSSDELPVGSTFAKKYNVIEEDKCLVLYDTDHFVPRNELIKETSNWLDRYLGPVKYK